MSMDKFPQHIPITSDYNIILPPEHPPHRFDWNGALIWVQQQESQFSTSASAWRSLCRKMVTLSSYYLLLCQQLSPKSTEPRPVHGRVAAVITKGQCWQRNVFCWSEHKLPLDRGYFFLCRFPGQGGLQATDYEILWLWRTKHHI